MFKGEVKGCYTEFCRFVSKKEKSFERARFPLRNFFELQLSAYERE